MTMGEPMTIRKMEEQDQLQVAEIYLKTRLAAFTWASAEELKSANFQEDSQGEVVFVYVEEQAVLGFLSVYEPENFVHHLFIRTDQQGRGIGQELLNYRLANSQGSLSLKCLAANKQALAFYQHFGFKVTSNLCGSGNEGFYQLSYDK